MPSHSCPVYFLYHANLASWKSPPRNLPPTWKASSVSSGGSSLLTRHCMRERSWPPAEISLSSSRPFSFLYLSQRTLVTKDEWPRW